MSMTGIPCVNHPIDRRHEGVDLDGLNGDEIPVARRHLLHRGQLLCRGEFGIEPCDVHVEQFSPELGRSLSWAHQLTWRPMFEKAARSGLFERRMGAPVVAAAGAA